MPHNQTGFTLIEIAMAMAIIGILLNGALQMTTISNKVKKHNDTVEILEDTTHAIVGYVIINGRLPCPDIDNDGQENRVAECTAQYGYLPWADLGVGRYDGWDNPIHYAMQKDFTVSSITTLLTPEYEIRNSFDEIATEPLLFPAIIWSSGQSDNNTADELENSNDDTVFVNSNHVDNKFDDIVIGIPRLPIINMLAKTRLLPNR